MASPDRLFRLDDKVALVTGGYGGIGAAVCRGLAEMGAKVAVTGHNSEKAAACAEGLKRQGYDAFAMVFDVASVPERFGGLGLHHGTDTLPRRRDYRDAIRAVGGGQ